LSQRMNFGGGSCIVADVLTGRDVYSKNGDQQRSSEFDLHERTDGGRMDGVDGRKMCGESRLRKEATGRVMEMAWMVEARR
jgi:hypothetical protein